jgi:hypothetical protein
MQTKAYEHGMGAQEGMGVMEAVEEGRVEGKKGRMRTG